VGKSGPRLTAGGSDGGLFTLAEDSGFCVDRSDVNAHTVQLAAGGRVPTTIPALASADVLTGLRLKVGDTFQTDAFGLPGTTLRFVGAVQHMPGQDDPARGVLVVPIGFTDMLDAHSGGVSGVTEWWAEAAGTTPARLAARYTALDAPKLLGNRAVADRQADASAIRHDPLRSGLRLTLVIAAIAAMLFILIGFALHSVIAVRERSSELALLNALGLSRRRTAALLLAEQAMLVLLGVAAGGTLAAVTIRSVLPLMILTDSGAPPVPRPQVLFDLPLLGAVGATAVLFLLATVGLVLSVRGRDALGQALRNGEER
jgi:predicted lysophospholipase L1 biosynthesis ABC-type transport system permease subunit